MSAFFENQKYVDCAVERNDYIVKDYVQEGALGTVYSGVRVSDGHMVALKIFGYTKKRPKEADVEKEVSILCDLKGVSGVVQIEGVFFDSEEGIIENKTHKFAYPVIVTEWLQGGALFDIISTQSMVSERYLAVLFQKIVRGLDNLHKKGYVHRDLKLENVMVLNTESDSEARIIDMGICERVPEGQAFFTSRTVQGTAGYYAPESIKRNEYSPKTDMWQLGCMLYAMLSGMLPFDPDYPAQITRRKYFEMSGTGWDNISSEGKDLVHKLLRKNPKRRYGVTDVLNHSWIIHCAPEVNMDHTYIARVKCLSLRQQLRCFFVRNDIEAGHRERRKRVQELLPFLNTSAADGESIGSVNPSYSGVDRISDYDEKLKDMKNIIVKSFSSMSHDDSETDDIVSSASPSRSKEQKRRGSGNARLDETITKGKVSYGVFVSLLLQCKLPELAQPDVFAIFDIDKTGNIDMKEFLLALLAFHSVVEDDSGPASATTAASLSVGSIDRCDAARERGEKSSFGSTENGSTYSYSAGNHLADDETAARLYFQVFDISNSGTISIDELRLVVGCLLQGGASSGTPVNAFDRSLHLPASTIATGAQKTVSDMSTIPNIEELFSAMDVTGDGQISFEEFLVFYHAVMRHATTKTASMRFDSEKISRVLSSRINSGADVDAVVAGDAFSCGLEDDDDDDDDDSDADDDQDEFVTLMNGQRIPLK